MPPACTSVALHHTWCCWLSRPTVTTYAIAFMPTSASANQATHSVPLAGAQQGGWYSGSRWLGLEGGGSATHCPVHCELPAAPLNSVLRPASAPQKLYMSG